MHYKFEKTFYRFQENSKCLDYKKYQMVQPLITK